MELEQMGTEQMDARQLIVSPFLAQKILKENICNRKISEKMVLIYAKDMSEGRWKTKTGEFIKISKTKRLLDGQHRLLAVIKANVSIEFSFLYEINDDVFDVLDTGRNRSKSDVFTIEKIPNASNIASIINAYLSLKKGNTTIEGKSTTGITNTLVLDEYRSNPEHWQNVTKFTAKIYNSFAKILSISTIGSFYSFFYDISPETSREFFNQLGTGESITNNSITLLRKVLLSDKISSRKMKMRHKNALIIKTWNAFRKNDNFKNLRFDNETDSFPKPI
jgi:hypothetical protein